VTVGTTKKCRQRPLCRIDMFPDSSGRSDALDTSGLDTRVDFVHHG
jgi:hypothetical protein